MSPMVCGNTPKSPRLHWTGSTMGVRPYGRIIVVRVLSTGLLDPVNNVAFE